MDGFYVKDVLTMKQASYQPLFRLPVLLGRDSRILNSRRFLEDFFNPDPSRTNSQWSRDTTAPASRLPLAKSDSYESVNHSALVPVPKKFRGLVGSSRRARGSKEKERTWIVFS